ncbi:endonuclease [Arsenicicoccus cauae]|uniref:endonuclease n=1 Tax=Arsenicicoccus cauae TaxID=2663847 RepID=UPI00370D2D74
MPDSHARKDKNAAVHRDTTRWLIEQHGATFAADAGITLQDKPAPLWQLLVLSLLLSTRIRSDIAVATARELWSEGWRTPQHLRESTWQQRVRTLGRGGYTRYDESIATRLDQAATLLLDRWDGDLRRLRDEADGDPRRIAEAVQEFRGIGPAGAAIFLREVQAVWPQVRPSVDDLVLKGAKEAGLPTDPATLATLVDGRDLASLAAALVRVARNPDLLTDR